MPSAKTGRDNLSPAANADDAKPSAPPVAHLLEGPKPRGVLRPYHGEQPLESGVAQVTRHPRDAGPGQIEPTKGRCGERVELVDVARAERERTAEIVDPRIPRRRPARVHDLSLMPEREALVALGEPSLGRGRLSIGPKLRIQLEIGTREKAGPHRHARGNLR